MAIKLAETICNEIQGKHEKAALWDIWCILNSKKELNWLLPFFWPKGAREPSVFARSLALTYNLLGGPKIVIEILNSPRWLSVADAIKSLTEFGGHPIDEKTLYILLRVARGCVREDVIDTLMDIEADSFQREHRRAMSYKEKRLARDAAMHRINRSRNLLKHLEIRQLTSEEISFRNAILRVTREAVSRNPPF